MRLHPGAHVIAFLPPTWPRVVVLLLVSVLFTVTGIMHFTNTAFFSAIVPPYLPAPDMLVYVSGVFEILGGIGVLVPATRRFSGYGLLALLVAVYPANIHMALNPELFPDASAGALYARLPFQFVFAALVWYGACSPKSAARGEVAEAPSAA